MSIQPTSLTPAQFEAAAGSSPALWSLLEGCRVVHAKFGAGTILSFAQSRDLLFQVRFDQPLDGIAERQFTTKGFGKFFLRLDLTGEQAEKVRVALTRRPASQPAQAPRARFGVPEQANNPVRRLGWIELKPEYQPQPGGQKPRLRRQPGDPYVKCPYCVFRELRAELAAHIRLIHPQEYTAWAKEHAATHRRPAAGAEAPHTASGILVEKQMARCPLCDSLLKPENYAKHVRKVHPMEHAPEAPLPAPKGVRQKGAAGKKKKIKRVKIPFSSPSGKLQYISMKVLNVSRKGKRYTRRF